jgi:hypothetical protein
MEKMLIITKGHARPNTTDQAGNATRGADLATWTAARYERRDEEGDENEEYHNKDNQRRERPKYSDPSAEDILYGLCPIHYAYLDGKRVSNHLMRDCRTFLRLQEAMELSQGGKQGDTTHDRATTDQRYQIQSSTGHPQSKVYISTMI